MLIAEIDKSKPVKSQTASIYETYVVASACLIQFEEIAATVLIGNDHTVETRNDVRGIVV
jgi:hypothetical protein